MPEGEAAVAVRPFWSGTITFGLVSVPVNLLPANRSNRTSLRMVSPEGRPLQRRYFTTRDEKPLAWEDIVRGYEIEKDRFVVVEDDELDRIAPERTRDIDLRVFVKASQINPIHFERAYYLTPAGSSTKAYRLLAKVMEDTDRAGIATFVMRAKEYLVAILAENGILRAETLRFAEEVRTPEDVGLPEPVDPPAAEVKRIDREIAKLEKKELDRKELEEKSAERLLKLVKRKVKKGEDVVRLEPEDVEESGQVIDLVEMLQRSLRGESVRGGRADGGRAPRGGSKGDGKGSKTDRDRASRDGGRGKGDGALSRRSKAELYERAQELDIPGRSSMTKDELVEAIRES